MLLYPSWSQKAPGKRLIHQTSFGGFMSIHPASIVVHNINQRVQYWVDQGKILARQDPEGDGYETWKEVFDQVFCDDISMRAFDMCRKAGSPLDYYDPDTSYEEDVLAFAQALDQWCAQHCTWDQPVALRVENRKKAALSF